jgi:hypothetical protein
MDTRCYALLKSAESEVLWAATNLYQRETLALGLKHYNINLGHTIAPLNLVILDTKDLKFIDSSFK